MKIGVVTFPGSNCDYDCYKAVQEQMEAEAVYLWHGDHDLQGVDAVFLPGGFSYGDYLRAGAIAAQSPILREVRAFAEAGGPVAGICNGFQILCEAALLPGALMRNRSLKFRSRSVHLRVERTDTPFTSGYAAGQVLHVPIAHGEGCYFADEATLDRVEGQGLVAFRYSAPDGTIDAEANPNGSARNIAGVVNERGNVLGMMPHPERAVDALLGSTDGLGLFRSLAAHLARA
ncbi:MAG: Phosphoribosylformylglycinamidine synthase, glutamine amidotransferase subunit [uncultured Gemmatimonadetes bacterium]|uniref:Phosphoribosylformylglycinamidine synthase subunit PurQ n=1 Tax=uncultured Gemmatimonadota bacterium TaxID=203437 RepID=A0A6J4KC59_9BACT|nr:MAG: Phosphoribosylformylglycinamidine synthase, glutamine amidotransferase subunit [uncultured Gemmatimonadota bacterium]